METNHDGEIDNQCFRRGAALRAELPRKSRARARANTSLDLGRRPKFPAVRRTPVRIDRPATRGLPSAINTGGVPVAPVTTDHRGEINLRAAIGAPAPQGAPVTRGHSVPINLQAAIGHPAVLHPRAGIGRRTDRANTSRNRPES
jgi:hypothetical protein